VIGLGFDVLRPVVIILAVLTHVTVLQRVFLTKKAAQKRAFSEGHRVRNP